MQHRRASAYGFTLIELMIVVAVVAILASIAYPSYAEAVRKGRRAQARSALVELMQQQERYMTQRNQYMIFNTSAAGAATFKVYAGDTPTNTSYSLTATTCDPATAGAAAPGSNVCVKLIATPSQPDPKVTNITLTSTGIKDCAQPNGVADKKICWP